MLRTTPGRPFRRKRAALSRPWKNTKDLPLPQGQAWDGGGVDPSARTLVVAIPFDLPTFLIAAAVVAAAYVIFGISAFGVALFTVLLLLIGASLIVRAFA